MGSSKIMHLAMSFLKSGNHSACVQNGRTIMALICSVDIFSKTFGMRDHGGFMYGAASRFQFVEKAFVRTALGS